MVSTLAAVALLATGCTTVTVEVAGTTTTGGTSSGACIGPVQVFSFSASSMEPTIASSQSLTVDFGAYRASKPRRGDIVVFGTLARVAVFGAPTAAVDRAIALPGEAINSVGGRVVINGKALKEPWLVPGTVTTGITQQRIAADQYFVMGDDRADSQDSRFYGPIPGDRIFGKVMLSGCDD